MALGTSWTNIASRSVNISGTTVEFYVDAKLNRQDVANNKSYVDLRLNYYFQYWLSSYDTDFYLTGYGWLGYAYRSWDTGASGTMMTSQITVNHNSDGTGSFTASGGYEFGGLGVGATTFDSSSVALPTIPRASVPTASPNPATVGAEGVTVTINTNRKASAFVHTVSLTCGSWSWSSSAKAVGASVAVTVPYSVIAQFSATSKTATCTITCVTFSGNTTIGTKTNTFTLQVDANADHPNIGTIAVEDTNSRTSAIVGEETFIYGISTLTATIPLTVSGDYTELASAVVTCGNRSQTYTLSGTSQTITFTFDKVDYNSLTVKVTDKRGNIVSKTRSYTLMPYQPVTVTAEARRTTATGSTAVGQIQGIAYGGNYGNASNSLTISYKYKQQGTSTWTDGSQTYTKSLTDGQQTYSEAITFAEAFDYQYQYDIQIIVNDLFNTATYFVQLMQGLPILSWDETEVDVWGDLHIHNRENPEIFQNVMEGFDTVFQYHANKNLLTIEATTTTVNGITFTVNDDGTITANGTATADALFKVGTAYGLKKGIYMYWFRGCPSGGGQDTYYTGYEIQRIHVGTETITTLLVGDDGDGAYLGIYGNWSENCPYYICIVDGQTVSNLVFKPMVYDYRIASDTFVQRLSNVPYVEDFVVNSAYNTKAFASAIYAKALSTLQSHGLNNGIVVINGAAVGTRYGLIVNYVSSTYGVIIGFGYVNYIRIFRLNNGTWTGYDTNTTAVTLS